LGHARQLTRRGLRLSAPVPAGQPSQLPRFGDSAPAGGKLGLSPTDVVVYDALWNAAKHEGGFLPAGPAVKFFGTAGLEQNDLAFIWGLSDSEPKGKLTKVCPARRPRRARSPVLRPPSRAPAHIRLVCEVVSASHVR